MAEEEALDPPTPHEHRDSETFPVQIPFVRNPDTS